MFPIRGALPDDKSYLVAGEDSDAGLVKKLQEALAAMVADGSWEAIYRKHQ